MLGCCGYSRTKFKDTDDKIDVERLTKVEESARKAGLTDEQIKKVKACRCPCHSDGVRWMC